MASKKWFFFLHEIDIFGKEPELYYKGRKKKIKFNRKNIYIIIYFNLYSPLYI